MKKQILLFPMFVAAVFVLSQCMGKKAEVAKKKSEIAQAQLVTHKEAQDSLLADSTAPRKPIITTALSDAEMRTFLSKNHVDSIFLTQYPDNGFYGADHYRIEFIILSATKDANDPTVIHVKGKNRYKKEVSDFTGDIRITKMVQMIDPNIDAKDLADMGINKIYGAEGTLALDENPNLKSSGRFSGTLKMEFAKTSTGNLDPWFYTEDSPSGGGGYRFDGNWTSFSNPSLTKPFIWASDLFSFANDILKDFSIGEREVEINEKYRHLGWDDFYENEEWWQASKKVQ